MDIRGLFPFYAPQYAAYIGLNVGLDSILDLIGGTTGKEKATVNPNTPASAPVVATIGRLY